MLANLNYASTHWLSLAWQEAPDWAHWAAMDKTGKWFWYEEEPKDEDGYFKVTTGRVAQFTSLPSSVHWRLSLQQRPAREELFFSSAEYVYAHLQS